VRMRKIGEYASLMGPGIRRGRRCGGKERHGIKAKMSLKGDEWSKGICETAKVMRKTERHQEPGQQRGKKSGKKSRAARTFVSKKMTFIMQGWQNAGDYAAKV